MSNETEGQRTAWLPIASAQKDGTVIDVWLGDASESDRRFYCTGKSRRSPGWAWARDKFRPCDGLPGLAVFVEPTHWMPLPEPPARASGEVFRDASLEYPDKYGGYPL